jgi:predicted GH43/DUF377 family glycosyl hydrolase
MTAPPTRKAWTRHADNPVVPVVPGTWKSSWTANPDIFALGADYLFYYRGQGPDLKDRIGVMTVEKERFDGRSFVDHPENPLIDVGAAGEFDSKYVLDPAAVEVDGKVYLYYSGISGTRQESDLSDSIGLAVSADGYDFRKHDANPLMVGRAPEVVLLDGTLYMLYSKSEGSGYFIDAPFQVYLATSQDGVHFTDHEVNPVLHTGGTGSWNSHTVTTPRVLLEDGVFYMMFAGDDTHCDFPKHFGLAASRDLVHWQECPSNPVYERGDAGSWDEGGIFFPTFIKVEGTYYMWYEGYGGGADRDKPFDKPGFSQIGLATLSGTNLRDWFPAGP